MLPFSFALSFLWDTELLLFFMFLGFLFSEMLSSSVLSVFHISDFVSVMFGVKQWLKMDAVQLSLAFVGPSPH